MYDKGYFRAGGAPSLARIGGSSAAPRPAELAFINYHGPAALVLCAGPW